MRNKWKKRHYTRMAVLQSLISPWKRKGKKKKNVITTRGIRSWSPIQYWLRQTGLNFVEQKECCPCGIMTLCWTHCFKLLRWGKISKREKPLILHAGFVRVLENLESQGILLWHFPGLGSPGRRPLVLESSGNLLNSTKNMKCMEGSKEN